MDALLPRSSGMVEFLIIILQICGIAALFVSRLASGASRRQAGRTAFVAALIGLGIAGAWCARHESEFGLFAGGTMTLLFIGMTLGTGAIEQGVVSGTKQTV